MKRKRVRILFIGNSHTYMNDMPLFVKVMAEEDRYECDVTMLAHGGWYLATHVKEAQTRFNVLFGKYDYIVLQEHSHPFDHIEEYKKAVGTIAEWAQQAGSRLVIYGVWARKDDEVSQAFMDKTSREVATENGALFAPVGENWWRYKASWPDKELYEEDGSHASKEGAEFAAKIIWNTIENNLS